MKNRNYKPGVTLIEMVIVVAIIALLATMVIGIVSRIDERSKEKGLENIFALLDSALQEYYEYWKAFPDPNNLSYPNHSAALYGQLYSTPACRNILEKITSALIRNNPPEIYDLWGTALNYRYFTSDNFPELISAGPDRKFGTSDDISSKK